MSLLLVSLLLSPLTHAESGREADRSVEGLDVEIEQLKEEILELNTLLFKLQEELLYPEDSSIIIFIAMEGGHYFIPDSLKLLVDDQLVASHLYTDREIEALKKGGVQRLYMGNLRSGSHRLMAVFAGKGPQAQEYKRAELVEMEKDEGARFIRFTIRDDPDKKEPEFIHDLWE
jgi:hypothetical protein